MLRRGGREMADKPF